VVHRRADDHHGAAVSFLGIERKFSRDRDDLVARHAGDLLRPGRRVRHVVVVGFCNVLAAVTPVEAVIRGE
jgi:hypothetical protein